MVVVEHRLTAIETMLATSETARAARSVAYTAELAGVKEELTDLSSHVGTQNGRLGRLEVDVEDHTAAHALEEAHEDGRTAGRREVNKRTLIVITLAAGAIPAIVAVVGVAVDRF